jgi:hypothetical protein
MIETTYQTFDRFHQRDRESFPYKHVAYFPFGQLSSVLNWCKTELQGDWRWELLTNSTDLAPGKYAFYFDLDVDLSIFLLWWER